MAGQTVQIDKRIFLALCAYFELIENPTQTEQAIKDALNAKLDKVVAHMYYTDSKTALTEEAREEARKKYLDARGILDDFRW